jgi:RNA polymerase sigma-70 factor, ECF subfamily
LRDLLLSLQSNKKRLCVDNRILRQIIAGDVEAYRLVVRELAPEIRLYLARRLPDFHQVEDLTQEVLAAVFWNLSRFDMNGDFGAWVRGFTKNKLNEHLRREYSRNNKFEKLKAQISMNIDSELATLPSSNGLVGRLHLCLEKLPEKMAELVRARYLENESVQGIAMKLDSSVSAISSHLYRLKKILKDCVEGRA